MTLVNDEVLKLAIQLVGPSLSKGELLATQRTESNVAAMIKNAYHAVIAAREGIVKD